MEKWIDGVNMPHPVANVGRVLLGILVLFAAWVVGQYLGDIIYPGSILLWGMEALAAKVGSSVAILAASLILRRYLLHSFGLALVCLATTEFIVLFIIHCFTGFGTFPWIDLPFSGSWLYRLTWNVVLAFLIGTVVGQLWNDWARSSTNV